MRSRPPLRSIAALAAIVCVATCTEAPTGPAKPAAASVGLVPVFSQSAAFAAQHLADFGLRFDSVRVVLRGFPDTAVVVKDTTIFFSSSGPDSVSLDLKIPIEAVRQEFSAGLDYKGPGGVVFHGGPVIVNSHPVNGPAPAGDSIRVNYVGPGHNVKAITISPKSVTLSGIASTAFTVGAIDSTGAPTAVPPLDWSSSNDALVSAAGSNTGGAAQSHGVRGSATITATSPSGISDNTVVTVVLPAASIAVVSGADQTGKAGSALPSPAIVQVSASDGIGVSGVTVVFAAPAGGGVGTASATTDGNGRAQTTLKLGSASGAQSFSAQAGAFSATIGATATAGDPTALAIVSGNLQSGTVNTALANALIVKVTDTFGNAVNGATINWARTGGNGTLGAVTSTSDATGIASNSYTLGSTAGSEAVSASIGGATVSFILNSTAGAPAAIAIVSGSGQNGGANQSLANPFVVKVTDAGGNAVANATVSWSANNGSIAPGSITDASGQTSGTLRLGSIVGAASAVATIANNHSVTFSATLTAGAASVITIVAGDNQSAAVGTAVATAPSVKITDASNNPLSGVVVTFAPASGSGSVSPSNGQATTNASGIATLTSWTLGTTAGAQALTASATGTAGVTFHATATAGAAANIAIVAGDNQTATVGTVVTTAPSVKITDASTNPLSGVVVTFAPAGGSGSTSPINGQATTNASGIATLTSWTLGATAGAQSLTASATGTSGITFHATASAGTASVIAIVAGDNQSATVGTAVPTAPSVKVTDASTNPLSGVVVTFAVASGGGTISPVNGQATTNASGIATLTSWTLGTTAGAQTLSASATGTGSATFHATANAAAADHMVITGSIAFVANAQSGTTSFPGTLPSGTVHDVSYNPVNGASVFWSLGTPCAAGFVLGTSPTTTNSSGIATAPAITVPNGTAGSCVLLTSLTNSFSPSSNRFYAIMKPAAATAWLGTSSDTAWATASNWSSGSAPSSATTIFVPVAVPSPKLLADGSGGSITLESGSTNLRLNTHILTASGDIVASGSGITNGTLTLNGTGTVNITGTLPTTNIGNGGSCGAFQLSGAASTGTITVNCPLTIGAQTLTVGGNFSTASATGVLVMTSAGGLVDVSGSSTFAGASEATFLTNGTFKARGDFAQSTAVSGASYAPSGLHATSLAGAGNQSVSFADAANSFFNDVDLSNAGVTTTFTTLVTVNHNLTANANTNLVQSGAGKRIVVAGTVTAATSANLGGVDSLRVTGTTFPIYSNVTVSRAPKVTQLTGAVVLTANRTVSGGLSIATSPASLELAGHSLTVDDSIDVVGTLKFLSASSGGTLTVGGKFNIDGGTVTAQAGTLQLSGDFTENGAIAPSAGFLTKFAGTGAQSVTFTHPSTTQSFFADLEIANTNVFGATFATNGVVMGTLTVDANAVLKTGGGLVITAMSVVTSGNGANMGSIAELVDSSSIFPSYGGSSPATTRIAHGVTMTSDATLTGSLIVQNTLDINSKQLTVKDFTVGTGGLLKMAAASDSVVVNGNAVFAGNSQDDFPFAAGAFDFKGNVTVSGTETFYVSNSTANTARFTSTSPQTISISGTNNFFANIGLGRQFQSSGFTPSNSSVTFATDARLIGVLDLHTNAAATINAGTTLTLTSSDPGLNFHNGTSMHVGGTVAPTTLVCQRDNSGATAPQINGTGTFGSISTIVPGSGPGTTIDNSCRTAALP
jgi:adhesin/invasin